MSPHGMGRPTYFKLYVQIEQTQLHILSIFMSNNDYTTFDTGYPNNAVPHMSTKLI